MAADFNPIDKTVPCPFCSSTETEMIALFGMQMMTSQYYCRHCRSAFEAVKWDEPASRPERSKGRVDE